MLNGADAIGMVAAYNNILAATLGTGNVWQFAPAGMARDSLRANGWPWLSGALLSWDRQQRIFGAVHLIAVEDGAAIPLDIWKTMLDLIRCALAAGDGVVQAGAVQQCRWEGACNGWGGGGGVQPRGSANAETTPAGAPAAAASGNLLQPPV